MVRRLPFEVLLKIFIHLDDILPLFEIPELEDLLMSKAFLAQWILAYSTRNFTTKIRKRISSSSSSSVDLKSRTLYSLSIAMKSAENGILEISDHAQFFMISGYYLTSIPDTAIPKSIKGNSLISKILNSRNKQSGNYGLRGVICSIFCYAKDNGIGPKTPMLLALLIELTRGQIMFAQEFEEIVAECLLDDFGQIPTLPLLKACLAIPYFPDPNMNPLVQRFGKFYLRQKIISNLRPFRSPTVISDFFTYLEGSLYEELISDLPWTVMDVQHGKATIRSQSLYLLATKCRNSQNLKFRFMLNMVRDFRKYHIYIALSSLLPWTDDMKELWIRFDALPKSDQQKLISFFSVNNLNASMVINGGSKTAACFVRSLQFKAKVRKHLTSTLPYLIFVILSISPIVFSLFTS